jgi:chitin synthase
MALIWLVYFSINLTNKDEKFMSFVYTVSTILGLVSVVMLAILTVDLVRGLSRSSSYLIDNENPSFVSDIPGGHATVDLIRYIVLAVIGMFALPLILYTILFKNIRILFEVIVGSLSLAFYSPTYLIILNTYALCRMDDLSWGTKGLDNGSDKD